MCVCVYVSVIDSIVNEFYVRSCGWRLFESSSIIVVIILLQIELNHERKGILKWNYFRECVNVPMVIWLIFMTDVLSIRFLLHFCCCSFKSMFRLWLYVSFSFGIDYLLVLFWSRRVLNCTCIEQWYCVKSNKERQQRPPQIIRCCCMPSKRSLHTRC